MSFVDCKPDLGIYMFCKCIAGPIIITLQCKNGCTSLILNQGVSVSCNGKFSYLFDFMFESNSLRMS